MTVLFLLGVNCAGAQVVWGMFPSFKCQESLLQIFKQMLLNTAQNINLPSLTFWYNIMGVL